MASALASPTNQTVHAHELFGSTKRRRICQSGGGTGQPAVPTDSRWKQSEQLCLTTSNRRLKFFMLLVRTRFIPQWPLVQKVLECLQHCALFSNLSECEDAKMAARPVRRVI
jgi:hypothetical protein